MRIPQEELEKKIKVPKTLSVLANMAGAKLLKAKLTNPTVGVAKEVLDGLSKTSRAYSILSEEIKSQISEKEVNPGYEEVTLRLPGMDEVVEGLDSLSEIVSGMVFPEPPKQIEVSNLKEFPEYPKFPDFPKSFAISNLPKPQKFPASISVNNFPEGLDIQPVIDKLQDNQDSLIEGLDNLRVVFDGDKVLGFNILDSKGRIIEDFSPRVTVTGGGGSTGGSSIPRNMKSGTTTVTTAGTAVRLNNDGQTAKKIDVQSLPTNTDTIYIGASNTSAVAGSEIGIGLEPGDVYTINFTSPEAVFVDAVVSGEKVTWNISS